MSLLFLSLCCFVWDFLWSSCWWFYKIHAELLFCFFFSPFLLRLKKVLIYGSCINAFLFLLFFLRNWSRYGISVDFWRKRIPEVAAISFRGLGEKHILSLPVQSFMYFKNLSYIIKRVWPSLYLFHIAPFTCRSCDVFTWFGNFFLMFISFLKKREDN